MNTDLNKGAMLRTATPMSNLKRNLQHNSGFLRFSILLLVFLATSINLTKGSNPKPELALRSINDITIVIQLSSSVAAGSVVEMEELFVGVAGFVGMSGSVALDPVSGTLTFTLAGGDTGNLPSDESVALLHLSDPVSGVEQDFLLVTDGGGTIMALDDF